VRGRLAAMLALVVAGLPVARAQSVSAQAPAQYIYVATITVEFGRIQDFEEYEHQIQEARRRVGDPRSVSAYQMQAGGAPNRFDVVIPFDDLSELDSWPSVPALLESAYGQRDGARIYAEGSATIESVEYVIQALQPDHSSGNGRRLSSLSRSAQGRGGQARDPPHASYGRHGPGIHVYGCEPGGGLVQLAGGPPAPRGHHRGVR